MVQIPKLQFGDFKKFITSREVLTGGSAILFTPILQASINKVIERLPFFKDHITAALILAAFIIFVAASKWGGIFTPVLLGISVGLFITAIEPFFREQLDKLGGK